MNNKLLLATFINDDTSIKNKYRIDRLGKELSITAIGLPSTDIFNYNIVLESVQIIINDEYDINLVNYCDVSYDRDNKTYSLFSDDNYIYDIDDFLVNIAETNGFELTKYTTPFLAKVDIDYEEKHNPDTLSDNAKKALLKSRELGFKNLIDLEKNGNDAQRNIISKIFQ